MPVSSPAMPGCGPTRSFAGSAAPGLYPCLRAGLSRPSAGPVRAVLSVARLGQGTSAFSKSLAEGGQFLLEFHDTAPCRVQTGCAFMFDREAAFLLHDHHL